MKRRLGNLYVYINGDELDTQGLKRMRGRERERMKTVNEIIHIIASGNIY